MTQFDPIRAELRFRLVVSLAGLFLMLLAFAWRGLPGPVEELRLVGLVAAFLVASAGYSWVRLIQTRED